MNIDLEKVKLVTNFSEDIEEIEEILRNIKIIFTTPEGTVPFDREFGIDWSILDNPLPQAKGRLTVEYIKKIKRFEPRARVREVTYEHEGADGILIPKVVIDIELE